MSKTAREVIAELGDDSCQFGLKLAVADSIISALKDAGYVIVPVEATPDMRLAGRDAWIAPDEQFASCNSIRDAGFIWNAMLAASQDQGRE